MKDEFKLYEFLPFQIFVISSLACGDLKDIYTKYDIETTKEWRIVALLSENGKMSMSQIVKETFIDPVNVTRAVENLFQKKICERYYDKKDRRRVDVELSGEGKRSLKKLFVELSAYEKKFQLMIGEPVFTEIKKNYPAIFKRQTAHAKPKIN